MHSEQRVVYSRAGVVCEYYDPNRAYPTSRDGGGAENRPHYSPPARPLVEDAANRKEDVEGHRIRRYEET